MAGGFVGFTLNTGSTNGNAGANSIFLTPVTAQQNGTATAVLIQSSALTTGISLKALVYDGSHSALLATGSPATSFANGYNRFLLTAPLSLTAGSTYYVGYVCNSNANMLVQTTGGTSWWVSGGQSVSSPANPLVGGSSSTTALTVALELDGTGLQQYGFGPDFATGVTLSSANAIATCTSTANRGVRGIYTRNFNSGKWYGEIAIGGTINNNVAVGIAIGCWGVTQGTGTLNFVAMLLPTGVVATTGSSTGITYASGDTVGVAYDAVGNTYAFNKNNGSWSATAAVPANSNGWPYTLAASTGATGTAAIFTLRDRTATQLYSPPAGFVAWASSGTATQSAVTVNVG